MLLLAEWAVAEGLPNVCGSTLQDETTGRQPAEHCFQAKHPNKLPKACPPTVRRSCMKAACTSRRACTVKSPWYAATRPRRPGRACVRVPPQGTWLGCKMEQRGLRTGRAHKQAAFVHSQSSGGSRWPRTPSSAAMSAASRLVSVYTMVGSSSPFSAMAGEEWVCRCYQRFP